MTAVEIVLIVIGIICIVASFIFDMTGNDKDEVGEIVSSELNEAQKQKIREQINGIIEEELEGISERTEASLDKISNTKILEMNEYAENVLGEINRNHNETVFLYDMLNEKAKEIKTTVKDVNITKRQVEKIQAEVKAADDTAVTVEPDSTFDNNPPAYEKSEKGVTNTKDIAKERLIALVKKSNEKARLQDNDIVRANQAENLGNAVSNKNEVSNESDKEKKLEKTAEGNTADKETDKEKEKKTTVKKTAEETVEEKISVKKATVEMPEEVTLDKPTEKKTPVENDTEKTTTQKKTTTRKTPVKAKAEQADAEKKTTTRKTSVKASTEQAETEKKTVVRKTSVKAGTEQADTEKKTTRKKTAEKKTTTAATKKSDANKEAENAVIQFESGMSNNEKILKMNELGYANKDIAKQLNMGVGEVKLVVDLYKGGK